MMRAGSSVDVASRSPAGPRRLWPPALSRLAELGWLAMLAWLAVLATGAVNAAPARAAGSNRAAANAAAKLLAHAFADARAAGSFHQTVSDTLGGVRGTLTNDVSLHAGRQAITTSNGTRAQVLVIGDTVYLSGNQHALLSYFRFTSNEASAIGGEWLSVPSTSSAFAALAYDVTVPTALAEVAPTGHLTESAPTTLDGRRVIGISGGAPQAATSGAGGTATLYVTATGRPLPVLAVMASPRRRGHDRLALRAAMSDFGERVAVTPPAAQIAVSELGMLARIAIPGAPGYFTFTGSRGYPAPIGRPWGHAGCEPVRFAASPSVPASVYRQLASAISAARRQGIDVTLETRALTWRHGALYYRDGQTPASSALVEISASQNKPPRLQDGQIQHVGIAWSTALTRSGHNEYLTKVSGTLWLAALAGRPRLLRQSILQLIAWTQGISHTTNPASGLSGGSAGFTAADVAAMLTMSGCARPAGGGSGGGGSSGGGIAA